MLNTFKDKKVLYCLFITVHLTISEIKLILNTDLRLTFQVNSEVYTECFPIRVGIYRVFLYLCEATRVRAER